MATGDSFASGLSVVSPLISLGFGLLGSILSQLKKTKTPQEVLDALQAAMDALEKHALDNMTKEEWEALRG